MRENDTVVRAVLTDVVMAMALLTRLPLPRLPDRAFARQARAAWAFPLAGLAVALPAIAVAAAAQGLGMPAAAAAGLCLAVQIALTGAMHEDGLADTADGLWGGFSPERRLEIMRDSRIGSYGVVALVLSLGLRWVALAGLIGAGAFGAVIAAAVLSRGALPVLMTALPQARPEGLSRAVGTPGAGVAAVALLLAAVLALGAAGGAVPIPAAVAGLAVLGLAALARARIGGQTGDILGAAQQLAEIALLLGMQAALA